MADVPASGDEMQNDENPTHDAGRIVTPAVNPTPRSQGIAARIASFQQFATKPSSRSPSPRRLSKQDKQQEAIPAVDQPAMPLPPPVVPPPNGPPPQVIAVEVPTDQVNPEEPQQEPTAPPGEEEAALPEGGGTQKETDQDGGPPESGGGGGRGGEGAQPGGPPPQPPPAPMKPEQASLQKGPPVVTAVSQASASVAPAQPSPTVHKLEASAMPQGAHPTFLSESPELRGKVQEMYREVPVFRGEDVRKEVLEKGGTKQKPIPKFAMLPPDTMNEFQAKLREVKGVDVAKQGVVEAPAGRATHSVAIVPQVPPALGSQRTEGESVSGQGTAGEGVLEGYEEGAEEGGDEEQDGEGEVDEEEVGQ